MAWHVNLDRSRCIGSGVCAGTAPHQFRLGNGVSTCLHDVVDPDQTIVDAAESCPTEAITVVDEVSHDLIAPL